MAKRAPNGAGSIRRRSDGRYEGRISVGFNPATGKQKQRSIYGWSQKEVIQKMQAMQVSMEAGDYTEPTKVTVGQWLDTWVKEYCSHLRESTHASYTGMINDRIKPALGATKLQKLTPPVLQGFYNSLTADGLKPGSVRNFHKVMLGSLTQAAKLGYIKSNPALLCMLPRLERHEMNYMDSATLGAFLQAIEGHQYEMVYFTALFTGARIAETLGLTWDVIDFDAGTFLINKQLRRFPKEGEPLTGPTKNGKSRTIKPAAVVMQRLKEQQRRQTEWRLKYGPAFHNPANLVFTKEWGDRLRFNTVERAYKDVVTALGHPELRVHDMRHTYAVTSLANGDDPLTVQKNLGHATATFTLDLYGHVSDEMRDASANRMQQFIDTISKRG